MTRAVFGLTELARTPFPFIPAEVTRHFKLSDADRQAALRQAGYVAAKRSHMRRKARYWGKPKYLQQQELYVFTLRAQGDCPTIRDAFNISVVN